MPEKHVSTLSVAALAVLFCSATAHSAELAVNGGFETGDFSGWDQFPQLGIQVITDVNPSEGVWAANLNADSPGGAPIDNVIKNANIGIGQVAPGEEVTVSFDARGTTASGGVAFAEFFSEIAGGGVSDALLLGGAPLALDGDPDVWTSFEFTVFAGPDVSGGVTLQLKAGCGAVPGCIADVTFDGASVRTAAVPLQLTIVGTCDGPGTVDIGGATPNGSVAVARGPNLDGFTVPSGSCAGTVISLGDPTLLKILTVDDLGGFSAAPNIPASLCGDYIQAVDLTDCRQSNVQGPL